MKNTQARRLHAGAWVLIHGKGATAAGKSWYAEVAEAGSTQFVNDRGRNVNAVAVRTLSIIPRDRQSDFHAFTPGLPFQVPEPIDGVMILSGLPALESKRDPGSAVWVTVDRIDGSHVYEDEAQLHQKLEMDRQAAAKANEGMARVREYLSRIDDAMRQRYGGAGKVRHFEVAGEEGVQAYREFWMAGPDLAQMAADLERLATRHPGQMVRVAIHSEVAEAAARSMDPDLARVVPIKRPRPAVQRGVGAAG